MLAADISDRSTENLTRTKNSIRVASKSPSMNDIILLPEVHRLANKAFRHHLISGYGETGNLGEYQLIYRGKPTNLTLINAHAFLLKVLGLSEHNHKSTRR
jgi:hypothetical protein